AARSRTDQRGDREAPLHQSVDDEGPREAHLRQARSSFTARSCAGPTRRRLARCGDVLAAFFELLALAHERRAAAGPVILVGCCENRLEGSDHTGVELRPDSLG